MGKSSWQIPAEQGVRISTAATPYFISIDCEQDYCNSLGGPAGLPLFFAIGYFGCQVGCLCVNQS